MDNTKIGSRIKKRREELGISQQELAEMVGFKTASAINKIEMGIRDVNSKKLFLISNYLKISPSDLVGKER